MVDTTLTPPALIDPPFKEPMLDASGIVSQVWQAWFTDVSRAQYATTTSGVTTSGVLLQTGTSTSGPLGEISVPLPAPFTVRTLLFQCDASPTEPAAYFNQDTVGALPLDVVTGTLDKVDDTDSVVYVPNMPFNWYAVGL